MHFCFIIISDLLIVLQNSLKLIYISINIIFSIWIVFICTAFMMKSLQLLKTLSNLKSTDLSKNKSNTNVKTNKCNLQMKTLNTNHTKHEMKSENNLSKDVLTDENAAKPKIKITDENELTVSFASDNTPSQCNVTDSGHSSKSGSLKRNESNSIYRQSPKFNHKRNKYSNKMTRKNSNHSISHTESGLKNITETIDLREETDDKRSL
ncbi:unnamed protein product [Medioppia subpectinata]|uniref:Uncharacterized protein n=1 Tax=Medioppia subpectinata TaxID=1979941 RepID=A0A7R9PV90_9ACAR|nr:unnamed protein product [Medioppia subpectinata]CAG2102424.1 unnamed protein product [Medioppia subpectinata]